MEEKLLIWLKIAAQLEKLPELTWMDVIKTMMTLASFTTENRRQELYYTHSGTSASKLDCEIFGKVGVWVPFPGDCPVPDGCAALEQGECPVEEGEEIVYDIALDIESFFPQISLDGKWTILDQNKDMIVCFTFPITIRAG